MHLSLRLLILLIAAIPAIAFIDNSTTSGLVAAITAAGIGIVAFSIDSTEAEYLSPLFRFSVAVAAIPAIWMTFQLVPMPVKSLSHPIWTSAAAALDRPLLGGMSADPGATLVTITRYFCAAGVVFFTAAVTVDRDRAERVLFTLVGATSAAAVASLVYSADGLAVLGADYDPERAAVMAAIGVLGTVVAAAAAIRSLERFETRRWDGRMSHRQFLISLTIWLAAWWIAWFVISERSADVFAAACGTATLAVIAVIRRLGIDRRVSAAVAAAALAVAIAVVAMQPTNPNDVTLRFATSAPPSAVQMAQQMVTDTRWTGAGAGAFASLAPIYREINDPEVSRPPTTAAAIAIELGRPALVFVLVLTVVSAALLAAGALRRGRDSFYPAASAACITAMTVELFTDASAMSMSVQVAIAAIVGLGLAQIKSRSGR